MTRTLSLPALALLALTVFSAAVPTARADGHADLCATPRKAVVAWLGSLPPADVNASRAVACFHWDGSSVPLAEREQVARRLKLILDARGYYVNVDTLPDDPEVEGDEGRIVVTPALPELFLVRRGGAWLISGESIGHVEAWYSDAFGQIGELVEHLPPWMRSEWVGGAAGWQILGVFALMILSFIVRALVAMLIANRGQALLKRMGESAGVGTMASTAKPFGTMVGAILFAYALPMLQLGVRTSQIGAILARLIATVSAVIVLYRMVDLVSDVFARRAENTDTKLDDQLVPLIRKTAKVFVAMLGVIFVLQNLDIDVSSLLAGASIGGLAFSLAARDTVANLFGSISIFADHPFQVGDWVIIEGKEGVVLEVGMRTTRIRAFDSSVITMPNSTIANAAIVNFNMREFRRQVTTLGVTYGTTVDQLEAFVEGIRAILRANPKVRQDAFEVHFRNFGASSLEVFLYFFLKVDTWSDELAQRQNLFLEIIRLAEELNIEFAFPTQTLHIESMAAQSAFTKQPVPSREEMLASIMAHAPEGERSVPHGRPYTDHGFRPGTAIARSDFDDDHG